MTKFRDDNVTFQQNKKMAKRDEYRDSVGAKVAVQQSCFIILYSQLHMN